MDLTKLNDSHKTLVPNKFTVVDESSKGKFLEIYSLYQMDSTFHNVIGCLMNAIITSNKPVFMMSTAVFQKLKSEDPNGSFSGDMGSTFKHVMRALKEEGVIEEIYSPSGFKGGKHRAGLYRVVSKDHRNEFKDQTNLETIEQNLLDEYVYYQGLELRTPLILRTL